LHRQVARLLALENAINVACRAADQIVGIGPIGDKAAVYGVIAEGIDRRKFVAGRYSASRS
jgi:hypothetical protein